MRAQSDAYPLVLAPSLRRIRLEQAYSQEELAHRAGVDRTTVMRGELGLPLRPSSVRKLARALGVKPIVLQQPDDTTP